jgi:hypothetical protein
MKFYRELGKSLLQICSINGATPRAHESIIY